MSFVTDVFLFPGFMLTQANWRMAIAKYRHDSDVDVSPNSWLQNALLKLANNCFKGALVSVLFLHVIVKFYSQVVRYCHFGLKIWKKPN